MTEYTLKDYRASHFLMSFIRSQTQGWYTRENILAKAGHPDGDSDKLTILVQMIEKLNTWNDAIRRGEAPFILDAGSIVDPDTVEEACRMLQMLFRQYVVMNERLNGILDNDAPLHERRKDFQYIVACMGWVYYAINHAVQDDNAFALSFNDHELLKTREGHLATSQKELNFVNYLFHSFNSAELYNAKTCSDIIPMTEVLMNEDLKAFATQADKYLTRLGK